MDRGGFFLEREGWEDAHHTEYVLGDWEWEGG